MTEELGATGFSKDWLTLREPADHAARSKTQLDRFTQWCKPHDAIKLVELGAGTGSNLRYLMPRLGHNQQWLLVDNDAALLEHLPGLLQEWADAHNAQLIWNAEKLEVKHANFSATIYTQLIELANQLDQLRLNDTQVITASALLDLTSAAWLDKLASKIIKHQCACLFALNYNGTIQWQPELSYDDTVSNLLNLHQLGDKGFGPALGPQAGYYLASQLEQQGRQVFIDSSNWQIDESSVALQMAIVEGWAPAAIEQDGDAAEEVSAWLEQRKAQIHARFSRLTVEHCDVLALP